MENNSAKYLSEIPDAQRYAEVTFLASMVAVSTVANLSLWAVILGTRSLRAESYNMLLLNLSLADLLVTMVSMPVTMVAVLMSRRLPKDILFEQLAIGTRRMGRQSHRFEDACKRDLKSCNISPYIWELQAGNRGVRLFPRASQMQMREEVSLQQRIGTGKGVLQSTQQPRILPTSAPSTTGTATRASACTATADDAKTISTPGAHQAWSTETELPIMMITCTRRWVFSSQTCTAMGFVTMLTLVSSVMSLGFVSMNRYIRICRPQRYKRVYTDRNVFFMTVGVWLLSVLLSSPPLLGWSMYDYLPRQSICFCDWSSSVSYTFFMVSACFGGPLLMMTFCNVRILQTYRNSQRRLNLFRTRGDDRSSALPPPRASQDPGGTASANGIAAAANIHGRNEKQPSKSIDEGDGRDGAGAGVSAHTAQSTAGREASLAWAVAEGKPAVTVTSLGGDYSGSLTKATSSSSARWFQVQPALTVTDTAASTTTTTATSRWLERSQSDVTASTARLGDFFLGPGCEEEDDDLSERFQSDDELVSSSAPAWTVTLGKRGARVSDVAASNRKAVTLGALDVWEHRPKIEAEPRACAAQRGSVLADDVILTRTESTAAAGGGSSSNLDKAHVFPACSLRNLPSAWGGNSNAASRTRADETTPSSGTDRPLVALTPLSTALGDVGTNAGTSSAAGKGADKGKDKVKARVKIVAGKEASAAATEPPSSPSPRRHARRLRAEEFQLALSLMVVIVVFVLCWLPFCVTMFLSVFSPGSLSRAPDIFTLLLGYSNSCLNPIIYGAMNKRVKEGYRDLWNRCFFCGRGERRRSPHHHQHRSQIGNNSLETDTNVSSG